ncbi:MAG: aminopeptidase P family N-terminal domain-containing protein, partial [Alphaproteobacteria bacterium]
MAARMQLSDPFEPAEYRTRLERFHAEMERRGLDAMLLYAQESLYYLYGYDQIGYWVYQAYVVPRRGEPTALVRIVDKDLVANSALVRDIRTWADDSDDDPATMTARILA